MSGECNCYFCISKCLFHLHLPVLFLYFKMSYFICMEVRLVVNAPKSIELC